MSIIVPTRRSPSTRTETKQQTREALVDAAEQLISLQGLDAPSLDAICDRAGFTRGAFYVHFRDRDDLVATVMARVGERYLAAVLGAESHELDLATIAQRFVVSVATGEYPLTRKGGVRPHQLLDACVRSRAIRERYVALVGETLARLGRAVGAGQKAGTLRSDVDAEQIAVMLLAAVIGAHTMLELRMPIDLASAAQSALTLLTAPRRAPRRRARAR